MFAIFHPYDTPAAAPKSTIKTTFLHHTDSG